MIIDALSSRSTLIYQQVCYVGVSYFDRDICAHSRIRTINRFSDMRANILCDRKIKIHCGNMNYDININKVIYLKLSISFKIPEIYLRK